MSRLAGSLQAWNAVRTQVSSQMEPLERTGCQQSQNSKAAAKQVISATGNECHQDKAAIVEFKNEASRLEGFLLLFLFGVFLWWYLEVDVFFSSPLHTSLPAGPGASCSFPSGQRGNQLQLLAADLNACCPVLESPAATGN